MTNVAKWIVIFFRVSAENPHRNNELIKTPLTFLGSYILRLTLLKPLVFSIPFENVRKPEVF